MKEHKAQNKEVQLTKHRILTGYFRPRQLLKMELYNSLNEGKKMRPRSTDTQGDVIRKCKALQQEVDDLKTHLSTEREYSRLLQDCIKDLRRELQQTNRELQREKYLKWQEMNRGKEARCPSDIGHVRHRVSIPMTERRSFTNEVQNFRQRAYRPIHRRWSRHMGHYERGGSESWRR